MTTCYGLCRGFQHSVGLIWDQLIGYVDQREKYLTYLKITISFCAHRRDRKRKIIRNTSVYLSFKMNCACKLCVNVYFCIQYTSVYAPWAVGHITRFPCLSFNEALLVYTSHLPPTANYHLVIWIYTWAT